MSIFLGESRHYPNAVKSLAINLSPNDKKEKKSIKIGEKCRKCLEDFGHMAKK